MAWYAAHVIVYFKLRSGVQDRYTVWENVFLIEVEYGDSAWAKATDCAKRKEPRDSPKDLPNEKLESNVLQKKE